MYSVIRAVYLLAGLVSADSRLGSGQSVFRSAALVWMVWNILMLRAAVMRRGTRVRPTLNTMDLVQDVHSPLYRLLVSLVSSSFIVGIIGGTKTRRQRSSLNM